jgi:ribosomal protein S18 acetylase RimI-like enzyme
MDMWLRSYYSNMTGYKEKASVFFKNHEKIIKDKHQAGEIICSVATMVGDDDLIMGFAVFGNDYTLHYVAVKETYKRMGIAKQLLRSFYKDRSEITVSHWTKDMKHVQRIYKANYNRYRFFT